jgi:transcription elongation factor GreA
VTEIVQNATWLTQEAYDRLKAELDHLSGPGRVEIAKRIEAAREEGDLRENGGYHAAKEEQGKQEARIRQLKELLGKARVGEPAAAAGVVALGSEVTVRFVGDDDTMTFVLGSREAVDVAIEVYSPQSPLGAAILGKKVGQKATFSLPNGRETAVEIIKAQPYTG